MKSVMVVAHKYLPQPDDDLVAYLNSRKVERVMHIYHSFPDAPDRRSHYRLYRNGELKAQGQSGDYRAWPDVLVYAKEMFFTLKWGGGARWERYIGMDGLCVLFGHMLRAAGRVQRTVFWAIDFVPSKRFASALKNRIYEAVNRHGCLTADEMWDLSPRMAGARARFADIPLSAYRSHRVVPYGLWLERIPRFSHAECEQRTLVFMGHLLEKQGVQLVLKALPRVVAEVPGFKFKIIGGGQYRQALEAMARELGVTPHCRFLGEIQDSKEMEREVARSAVAIAPYVRSLDKWTAYADPGKVKTYLACGVPVLLTEVPWNASEIEQRGAGQIITEDPEQIANAIVASMNNERNQNMRDSATRYAAEFDWAQIFRRTLGHAAESPTGTEP